MLLRGRLFNPWRGSGSRRRIERRSMWRWKTGRGEPAYKFALVEVHFSGVGACRMGVQLFRSFLWWTAIYATRGLAEDASGKTGSRQRQRRLGTHRLVRETPFCRNCRTFPECTWLSREQLKFESNVNKLVNWLHLLLRNAWISRQ